MSDDEWVTQRAAVLRYRREHGYGEGGQVGARRHQAPAHGIAGYQRGCRCNECRHAKARANRRQREARRNRRVA